jgi:ABC-2 type transport system ATP-binding protein
MNPILKVSDVVKHYDDFTLGSISFEMPAGSVVGVFGPNGAGKTTLLKALHRQIHPDSGSIEILGMDFEQSEKALKNLIGYVPQEPSFYWEKSVSWTARFVSRFYDEWDGAKFHRLLDYFKVNPLKKVKHLSRGQKTLLGIAIAFSHGAKLLVLDEPTAGLDMIIRRELLFHVRKFAGDHDCGVIIASHFTDGLDDICDYVYFMSQGKEVLYETRDELLDEWKWLHFKEGSIPDQLKDSLIGVEKHPFHVSGLTDSFEGVRQELTPGLSRGDIRLENATLDDILIALLKGETDDWPD